MSETPTNIGRYEIVNSIGQGGMGSLYLAWDPKLERKIAIKLLRDDDDGLRERFSREARAAARLRHPNIVTIFDVGDHDGQPFIAMEYIQGHTLAEMIHRQTAMPLTRKLELMEALCDGLGFAHKSGIVHRDVKPANLMVDAEGSLKILDFGIARASESAGMTQAGMLIGTLNYMSPEQVNGQTVDSRSDIFAVGAVCYELLSYRQAFPGGLLAGILNKILSGQPDPLPGLVPGLDPEVVRIVEKALQKDPASRYQELQSMRKELLILRMRLETQASPQQADPISEMKTIIAPTPAPVRRTTDREDLQRRRSAQIDGHMAEAEAKFAAGDFKAAIAACEHALLLDADHHRANELLDRSRAALEERQLAEYMAGATRELQRGAVTAAREFLEKAALLNAGAPGLADLRQAIEAAARQQAEARQRAEAVRQLVERAQAAFDRSRFADSIQLADEALVLDASSDEAKALKARAVQGRDAQERAALEARARAAVDAAQRTFEAGRHDEAIAALVGFEPRHEITARALDRLRADAARIAAQQRAEAERRARQERIAAGLAATRATMSQGRFAEAVDALRALERAEGAAPEIAAALADAEGKHREAERVARVAREAAAHVEAAADLLGRKELQAALGRANAALALDSKHDAARQLQARILDAIRTEAERKRLEDEKRKAEEAAARQREKASAAAIKQARKARTPEAAIALLRDALHADPDNVELQLLLEGKQADLARQQAELREKQRLAAEQAEQARQAAEQAEKERQRQRAEQEKRRAEQAEEQRRRAEQAEQERQRQRAEQEKRRAEQAEEQRRRTEQAEQERRKAKEAAVAAAAAAPPAAVSAPVAQPSVEARRAPAVAKPTAPKPAGPAGIAVAIAGNQRMILIGAAALVVILVVGYFAMSGSDSGSQSTQASAPASGGAATGTPPQTSPPPPQTQTQSPTQPPAQTPPQIQATPPAATAAQPPTPPPAEPTPPSTPATGAPDPMADPAVARRVADLRVRARRQWMSGDRTGALATAESGLAVNAVDVSFRALVREMHDDARKRAAAARATAEGVGQHATSQTSFREGAARFDEADRLGPRRMPQATRSFWAAEESFTLAASEGRTAAAKEAAAAKAAATKPAAAPPPVTAPPVTAGKPEPPPTPPPAPSASADETAIVSVMQRLGQAYTKGDARTVSSLIPSLVERRLRDSFDQLSGQKMELTDIKVTVDRGGTSARVTCHVFHETRPKAGNAFTFNAPQTFFLEKRNGTWVILRRQ